MIRIVSAARAAIVALLIIGAQPAQAGFFNNTAFLSANKADENGDYIKAARLYAKVVEGSSPELAAAAAHKLYKYYLNGMGVAKDLDTAVRYLEVATQSSDPTWAKIANWEMGYQLMTGFEGAQPVKRIEAVPYFLRAKELGSDGSVKALEILELFPEVILVARSDLFSEPSEKIAPYSLSATFKFLNSGDVKKARTALNWHAQRGNEQAQLSLALLLLTSGSPGDQQEAGGWFLLAARSGNANAQRFYGLILMEIAKASPPEAMEWLQRSADQGDPDAANFLGQYTANPLRNYAQPDYAAAANHFRRAIELGSPKAALNLGNLFAEGLGVPRDTATAIELYKTAADAGLVEARNLLFSKFDIVYRPAGKGAQTAPQAAAAPQITSSRELSPIEIYQRNAGSVFFMRAAAEGKEGGSTGSAVAISNHEVLTNCHVAEGQDIYGIKVNGSWVRINYNRGNKIKDLCVYNTDLNIRPISQIRRYETLIIGEKVFAIGSPKGLENTLSEGIISAIRIIDGRKNIQTTAPIDYGSSGGALFDGQGRLIGITTWSKGETGNLNFAVSIDEAP